MTCRLKRCLSAMMLLLTLSQSLRINGDDTKPATKEFSPRDELVGVVLSADGRPAAGAQVAVANWTTEVQLAKGLLTYSPAAAREGHQIIVTDANGRFKLPAQHDPQVLVVAHDSGFAEIEDPRASHGLSKSSASSENTRTGLKVLQIKLQKWGRIMGIVRLDQKPQVGAQFRLVHISPHSVLRAPSAAFQIAETDAEGRFLVLRVPPGPVWCQRVLARPRPAETALLEKNLEALAWTTECDVPAGGFVKLPLVTPGITVRGRLLPPDGYTERLNWLEAGMAVAPHYESIFEGFPPRNRNRQVINDVDGQMVPWSELLGTPERKLRSLKPVSVAADGSFQISNLPPGNYRFKVDIPGSPVGGIAFFRVKPATNEDSAQAVKIAPVRLKDDRDPPEEPDLPPRTQPWQPDAAAQALAVKAFSMQAAIARLPKFYYRIRHQQGNVLGENAYREDFTLDKLQRAIDGPPVTWPRMQQRYTFAWSNKEGLVAEGADASTAEVIAAASTSHSWTPGTSVARSKSFNGSTLVTLNQRRYRGSMMLSESSFLSIISQRMWWGIKEEPADRSIPGYVPIECADYRSRGIESFNGEPCDVIESAPRAERLWISRKSGRLSGVLHFQFSRDGFRRIALAINKFYELAGSTLQQRVDGSEWCRTKATPAQLRDATIRFADAARGSQTPLELFSFRDYREAVPGIWIPYREDRAYASPYLADFNFVSLMRGWSIVEEVRVDFDLAETLRKLEPKDGEQIRDLRFDFPIDYSFSSHRSAADLLRIVNGTSNEKKMRNFNESNSRNFRKPLPPTELPRDGWIGGKIPNVAGKPYLLHFWAEWSPSSFKDFPALQKLATEGATVIGVHPGGSSARDVAKVITDNKLTYATVIAPANGLDQMDQHILGYPVWIFPEAVLVDAAGKIVEIGPVNDALLTEFQKLRKEPVPEAKKSPSSR